MFPTGNETEDLIYKKYTLFSCYSTVLYIQYTLYSTSTEHACAGTQPYLNINSKLAKKT